MDTRTPPQHQGAAAPNHAALELVVRDKLETMKQCMPRTMECIEDRVQHFGPEARALVRRALRGERGCFYAIEGGHVMGNPVGLDGGTLQALGDHVVILGCSHVCIWPAYVWAKQEGEAHGPD